MRPQNFFFHGRPNFPGRNTGGGMGGGGRLLYITLYTVYSSSVSIQLVA